MLGVGVVGSAWWWRHASHAENTAAASATSADSTHATRAADVRASQHDAADNARGRELADSTLTSSDAELPTIYRNTLDLYDQLAESIESLSPDCAAMADAMSQVIDERAVEANRLVAQLEGERSGSDEPEAAALKTRIEQLHVLLKSQMPRCSTQLLPVMKRWAEAGVYAREQNSEAGAHHPHNLVHAR